MRLLDLPSARFDCNRARYSAVFMAVASVVSALSAQTIVIDSTPAARQQEIDGFGTCISSTEGQQAWWQNLFLDDLGASILRLDLVPRFKTPWADYNYYSPWYLGNGAQPFAFNFQIQAADTPRFYVGTAGNPNAEEFTGGSYNGPEGTRVRTYTSAADYGKLFGDKRALIAVMGPNIDDNIARYFNLAADHLTTAGAIVTAVKTRDPALQRYKLIGSIWSPAPWLKVSSGSVTSPAAPPQPPAGVAFPYIWAGNFVGGKLDVSERAIEQFDDSALPADPNGPNAHAGRGRTSALTQFARCTAAYLRALQNQFGVRFHAVSIQNELNFETFYNSCTYPLSSQYIAALKYVRAELDKYADLRDIKLMGPEDLLSDSTYSLWQYGGGGTTVHKNLQYLQAIAADPAAAAAVGLFSIHGYAPDGVASAGANPEGWARWANGWTSSPAAGIPANVKGFRDYGKKSWMTETSGENSTWGTITSDGGFSIAVKIHQALTTGQQSAWVYWQMTDGNGVSASTLTDATARAKSAKFTALRHFSRYIRPGAVRLPTTVNGSTTLLASAYLHETDRTATIVLVNTGGSAANASLQVPATTKPITTFTTLTSSQGAQWQSGSVAVSNGAAAITVPASGVVTLVGTWAPTAGHARIINLSARGRVGTGDALLIAGFVLDAPGKTLLARAVGPSLVQFGVSQALMDPTLTVFNGETAVASNNDWGNDPAIAATATNVGAMTLAGSSKDAALLPPINQRIYTVHVRGAGDTTGVALAEVYDSDPTSGARLVNVSARCGVGTGDDILIAGFVIIGDGPRQVLVRGLGPRLAPLGVAGNLADPKIELYQIRGSTATLIAQNDDWGGSTELSSAFSATGGLTLPADSKDAALLAWLEPGVYTAQIKGVNETTGVALVEVTEMPD